MTDLTRATPRRFLTKWVKKLCVLFVSDLAWVGLISNQSKTVERLVWNGGVGLLWLRQLRDVYDENV